jgi:hypothetical protein
MKRSDQVIAGTADVPDFETVTCGELQFATAVHGPKSNL